MKQFTPQNDEQQEAKQFYNSSAWKKLRLSHLQDEPFCRSCGTHESLQVHHVKPRKDYPDDALDPENLQTLCNRCHGKETYAATLAPDATGHAVLCGPLDACKCWIAAHGKEGDLVFNLDAIGEAIGYPTYPRPNDVISLLIEWRRELVRRIGSQRMQRRCVLMVSDEAQAQVIAQDMKARLIRLDQ